MPMIDPKSGLALIGQSRTWKQVMMLPPQQVDPKDFWAPMNQRVATAYPHGLWMIVVQGMRSDDVPFQVSSPTEGRMFRDPSRLGYHIAGMWQFLNGYLNCGCVEGKMCDKHKSMGTQVPPVDAPSPRPN